MEQMRAFMEQESEIESIGGHRLLISISSKHKHKLHKTQIFTTTQCKFIEIISQYLLFNKTILINILSHRFLLNLSKYSY